jgi:hypothetical protein
VFLLSVTLIPRTDRRAAVRRPAGPAYEHRGRPPPAPSIYRLSVLRR